MKITQKQQQTIDWLKEIQQQHKKDITLRYVNDYWRVCPASINNDNTLTVHLNKINMKTWESLIKKGIFEKMESNLNDEGFIYICKYGKL